jgi:hypothetical protein
MSRNCPSWTCPSGWPACGARAPDVSGRLAARDTGPGSSRSMGFGSSPWVHVRPRKSRGGSAWKHGDRLHLDGEAALRQAGDDLHSDHRWVRSAPPHVAERPEPCDEVHLGRLPPTCRAGAELPVVAHDDGGFSSPPTGGGVLGVRARHCPRAELGPQVRRRRCVRGLALASGRPRLSRTTGLPLRRLHPRS